MKVNWPQFPDSALSFTTKRGERLPGWVFKALGKESRRLCSLPPWDPEILYLVAHGGWPADEEEAFIRNAMEARRRFEANPNN